MRSVTAIVWIVVVAHAEDMAANRAGTSQDVLLDRALKASLLNHGAMDETTLGKSGRIAAPAAHHSASTLPSRSQPSSVSVSSQRRHGLPSLALSREDGSKVAGAMLAALLALSPVTEAQAARSGGRMGGSAGFSSRSMPPRRPMPPPAARMPPPAASAPRTNILIAPSIGGGGFGYSPFGGGYGYSPFGSPFGGGMSSGTYLGLSLMESLIREQQRQAYLQQQLRTQRELGRDQAQIQQLQAELAAQDAKVDSLKAKAPPMDEATIQKLQQQLLEQQKQIDALKAEKAR